MKKLIYILTCLSLVFSFCTLCCFAAGGEGEEAEARGVTAELSSYEENLYGAENESANEATSPDYGGGENDTAAAEDKDSESPSNPGENQSDGEENDSSADVPPSNLGASADENTQNPFEALYNAAIEHSGEIFSALACLFSAVLMLCYRKGIMPLIQGGIGAISGSVSTISREAERQSMLSEGTKEIIDNKLSSAEELLSKISKSFEDYDNRLKTCEGLKSFENNVRQILLSQIDLLYEVFMNSSLPQYEKDRIGEMVSAMKRCAAEESEGA